MADIMKIGRSVRLRSSRMLLLTYTLVAISLRTSRLWWLLVRWYYYSKCTSVLLDDEVRALLASS
jgi:hypothetical protein